MELSSLLGGSDNLYKYLLTVGVAFILIALVYPLQKEQDLKIEIIGYNKEVVTLNHEISSLLKEVKQFESESNFVREELDSLRARFARSSQNQELQSQLQSQSDSLKVRYELSFRELEKRQNTIEVTKILIEFNKNRIETIEQYSLTYSRYYFLFLIVGIPLSIAGLLFWIWLTVRLEKTRTLEMRKISTSIPAGPTVEGIGNVQNQGLANTSSLEENPDPDN